MKKWRSSKPSLSGPYGGSQTTARYGRRWQNKRQEEVRLIAHCVRSRTEQTLADYYDDHGWRAYAHKQAVIYENLARECKTQYELLPKLVAKDELDEANKAQKDEEERERDKGQIEEVSTDSSRGDTTDDSGSDE